MRFLKIFLFIANSVHLLLFLSAFYFCIMAFVHPDSPLGLEPEDFWGVIILGGGSFFFTFLTFINLMRILGYFRERSLCLVYINFGSSGLFFLIGVAGIFGADIIDREMLVGFLPSIVFLCSGYFIFLGRDVSIDGE